MLVLCPKVLLLVVSKRVGKSDVNNIMALECAATMQYLCDVERVGLFPIVHFCRFQRIDVLML